MYVTKREPPPPPPLFPPPIQSRHIGNTFLVFKKSLAPASGQGKKYFGRLATTCPSSRPVLFLNRPGLRQVWIWSFPNVLHWAAVRVQCSDLLRRHHAFRHWHLVTHPTALFLGFDEIRLIGFVSGGSFGVVGKTGVDGGTGEGGSGEVGVF